MGIYTNTNRFSNNVYDYAAEIPANEAYGAALGCAQILADNQKNDMALFESAIQNDVAEISAFYNEGVQVLNENAFTNVIKKIVEMFKKLLGKIKGIFMSFIAKLRGAFSDGKKLVKKYDGQIRACGSWKKFKVKGVRKPKNDDVFASINELLPLKLSNDFAVDASGNITEATTIGSLGTVKTVKDMDVSDLKEKILKSYLKNGFTSEVGELHERAMEELFADEEVFSGEDGKISAATFNDKWIRGVMEDESKTLDNVKAHATNADKLINKIIDDLSKLSTKLESVVKDAKSGTADTIKVSGELLKAQTHDNTAYNAKATSGGAKSKLVNGKIATSEIGAGDTVSDVQKLVNALQKVATNEQEIIAKVTGEALALYKFAIGQGKKIYTAAAAYSSTKHVDEGVDFQDEDYINAVAESVEEEFYANMESLH